MRTSSAAFVRGVLLGAMALAGSAPNAGAVSRHVKDACREDYFNYCNKYDVGSSALRQCMRKNQRRLSPTCVNALVSSGEASPAEVARARARAQTRRAYNR
ncbi:MAG: hypothetical protein WC807_14350 [Hyphomicrobium sp.]|jgi:hypothetical protein